MKLPATILPLALGILLTGCASTPPRISMNVPAAFNGDTKYERFRQGDVTLDNPPYLQHAEFPEAEYRAVVGERQPSFIDTLTWRATVTRADATRVREVREFIAEPTSPRFKRFGEQDVDMLVRSRRKTYSWGEAAVFGSQYTQDGPYVPCNGHLNYEVLGTSWDGQYVVSFRFDISHPALMEWGSGVHSWNDGAELKRDPAYITVETAPAHEFSPNLDEIDQIVNSLKIQ